MIEFHECDVIVNGRGLVAETASISQENSLQSLYVIGRKGPMQYPNGPLKSSFDITYLVSLQNDPNLELINQLKANGGSPFVLEVAGIRGLCHLERFSLNSQPNEPTRATASYSCFYALSGAILPKRGTVEYAVGLDKTAHGWTTFITSSGSYLSVPTYGFQYSVDLTWQPTYSFGIISGGTTIGVKTPSQVDFIAAQEKVDIIRDEFALITFSGDDCRQTIFSSADNSVEILGISFAWGIPTNNVLFALDGGRVNSSRFEIANGSYSRANISIVRNF
jgi:hypothetical protein